MYKKIPTATSVYQCVCQVFSLSSHVLLILSLCFWKRLLSCGLSQGKECDETEILLLTSRKLYSPVTVPYRQQCVLHPKYQSAGQNEQQFSQWFRVLPTTNYSTETVLIKVINDLKINTASNKASILPSIDLTAAFDTTDHNILLSSPLATLNLAILPLGSHKAQYDPLMFSLYMMPLGSTKQRHNIFSPFICWWCTFVFFIFTQKPLLYK